MRKLGAAPFRWNRTELSGLFQQQGLPGGIGMGHHWRTTVGREDPSDRAFEYLAGWAFGIVTTVATVFAVWRLGV
jgi:hypothetical protein